MHAQGNKILKLDFVDMAELCPESSKVKTRKNRYFPSLWSASNQLLTFWSGRSVLHHTQQSRQESPHVNYYQKFEGYWWIVYHTSFRHRVAIKKTLNWSEIDSSLFNTPFSGRAKTSKGARNGLVTILKLANAPHAPSPLFQLSPGVAYNPLSSLCPELAPTQWIQGPPMGWIANSSRHATSVLKTTPDLHAPVPHNLWQVTRSILRLSSKISLVDPVSHSRI